MAMFGNKFRLPDSQFQPAPTYQTPGIGDGLSTNASYLDPQMQAAIEAAPAQPQKIGTGRMIAGYIGDALARWGGLQPTFAPVMLQQQQERMKAAQAERERQHEREDYVWKLQQKAQFPDGGSDPDLIQLQAIADDPNRPASQRETARRQIELRNDPIVNVSLGGRDFAGPRSLFLNGGRQPSAPAPSSSLPDASQGGFMTAAQAKAIGQGVNFREWQQRNGTPVLVNSPEEMASLPAGTIVISPDGRRGVKR